MCRTGKQIDCHHFHAESSWPKARIAGDEHDESELGADGQDTLNHRNCYCPAALHCREDLVASAPETSSVLVCDGGELFRQFGLVGRTPPCSGNATRCVRNKVAKPDTLFFWKSFRSWQ